MATKETHYTVDLGRLRLYKVVVANEGVKAWIEIRDNHTDNFVHDTPHLFVDSGVPEGSVILIKGQVDRTDGGSETKFRLFRFMSDRLIEMGPKEKVGGWRFSSQDGQLSQDQHDECVYRVAPDKWGYCQIVEHGWDAHQHFAAAMLKAGFVYEVDSLPPINSWPCYLAGFNKAIKNRQRAEKAEDALRLVTGKLLSHDLLDAEVGSKHRKKGHLRALANAPEPTQHCAAGVIHCLRESYEFCREALPELPELPPNVLNV
mgnify:CR=1 FL=1